MPTQTNWLRYSVSQLARRSSPWDSGAADLLGVGCAVHAVAGFVQAHPGDTDRIFRARWQDDFMANLLQFVGFREQFGIDGVIGIRDDDNDVQFAHGPFFDFFERCCREKMQHQVRVGIKCFQVPIG